MKIYLLFAIAMLLMVTTVSAVPQAIFSTINLTIGINNNTLTYRILTEGVDATENLVLSSNLNFTYNYSRTSIPMVFSRDICDSTDAGILINALRESGNSSLKWEECLRENSQLWVNYSDCQNDRGYKGNYTLIKGENDNLKIQVGTQQKTIEDKDDEIKTLQSHRFFLVIGIVAAVAIAYFSWRRNTPKIAKLEGLSNLPRTARM